MNLDLVMGLNNISARSLYWTHCEQKKQPAGICRSHKIATFFCCVKEISSQSNYAVGRHPAIHCQYQAAFSSSATIEGSAVALNSTAVRNCFCLEGRRCLFQAPSWNWHAHKCVQCITMHAFCVEKGDPICLGILECQVWSSKFSFRPFQAP